MKRLLVLGILGVVLLTGCGSNDTEVTSGGSTSFEETATDIQEDSSNLNEDMVSYAAQLLNSETADDLLAERIFNYLDSQIEAVTTVNEDGSYNCSLITEDTHCYAFSKNYYQVLDSLNKKHDVVEYAMLIPASDNWDSFSSQWSRTVANANVNWNEFLSFFGTTVDKNDKSYSSFFVNSLTTSTYLSSVGNRGYMTDNEDGMIIINATYLLDDADPLEQYTFITEESEGVSVNTDYSDTMTFEEICTVLFNTTVYSEELENSIVASCLNLGFTDMTAGVDTYSYDYDYKYYWSETAYVVTMDEVVLDIEGNEHNAKTIYCERFSSDDPVDTSFVSNFSSDALSYSSETFDGISTIYWNSASSASITSANGCTASIDSLNNMFGVSATYVLDVSDLSTPYYEKVTDLAEVTTVEYDGTNETVAKLFEFANEYKYNINENSLGYLISKPSIYLNISDDVFGAGSYYRITTDTLEDWQSELYAFLSTISSDVDVFYNACLATAEGDYTNAELPTELGTLKIYDAPQYVLLIQVKE